jgi:hypothetical protein
MNDALLFALILIGWFLSGRWRWKFDVIRRHPITLPAVLLTALVLLGITYTDAPKAYINHHLYVYSKLPLMLMLLTLFHDPRWQRHGLLAFAIGSVITVVSTYANIWFQVPWSDSHNQGGGSDGKTEHGYGKPGGESVHGQGEAEEHGLAGRNHAGTVQVGAGRLTEDLHDHAQGANPDFYDFEVRRLLRHSFFFPGKMLRLPGLEKDTEPDAKKDNAAGAVCRFRWQVGKQDISGEHGNTYGGHGDETDNQQGQWRHLYFSGSVGDPGAEGVEIERQGKSYQCKQIQ